MENKSHDNCNEVIPEDLFDLSDEMKGLTDIQKLAVVQWAMKHIVEHATEGGSFRYLIYNRLGFDTAAYAPLLSAGMIISNEFDLSEKKKWLQLYRKHLLLIPTFYKKEEAYGLWVKRLSKCDKL